jgi:hypothetical protein
MSRVVEMSPDSSVSPDNPVARMISDGGAVSPDSATRPSPGVRADAGRLVEQQPTYDTRVSTPSLLSEKAHRAWTRIAHYTLGKIGERTPRDLLEKAWRRTVLAEDLLKDFKNGTYSQVSKRSIAVIGSGLALASKWGDPSRSTVNKLASACLSMVVTEVADNELRRYCQFKNYELQHYFG